MPQRQTQERRNRDTMIRRCIQGLNALYSGEKFGNVKPCQLPPSAAQGAALEHIFTSVQELGPLRDLDGPGALQQFRAPDGYGEDQTPAAVKSYDPSLMCRTVVTSQCHLLHCWVGMGRMLLTTWSPLGF